MAESTLKHWVDPQQLWLELPSDRVLRAKASVFFSDFVQWQGRVLGVPNAPLGSATTYSKNANQIAVSTIFRILLIHRQKLVDFTWRSFQALFACEAS